MDLNSTTTDQLAETIAKMICGETNWLCIWKDVTSAVLIYTQPYGRANYHLLTLLARYADVVNGTDSLLLRHLHQAIPQAGQHLVGHVQMCIGFQATTYRWQAKETS